jgi:hypothetical protein
MKLIIDSDACLNNGTCIGEVLLLYEYALKISPESMKQSLIDKGYITNAGDLFGRYTATDKAVKLLDNVLADSSVDDDTKITELATKLKELYPKGKKEGTNQFWADGVSIIVKRLKIFYKKYGFYDNDIIIKATEDYIKSFNGDYRFMKTLKYFLWSEKVNKAGEVEPTSDLLTYIENASEIDELSNDWLNDLK